MPRKKGGRQKGAAAAIALTIAGSDSSGGAGIQADLKTFKALGVYGLTAVTGLVAETPGVVFRMEPARTRMVSAQLQILLESFRVTAAKTGLLFSSKIVSEVARILRKRKNHGRGGIHLVVDPVIVATSGDRLLADDAIAAYEKELFPLAALITPNLGEATRLFGEPVTDLRSMRRAGARLTEKYRVPVLMKGGHLSGTTAIDLLFMGDKVIEFTAAFSRDIATHGTGCTYSAAITAGLASGLSLEKAVLRAKRFVTASIDQCFSWKTESGKSLQALNHSPNNWK